MLGSDLAQILTMTIREILAPDSSSRWKRYINRIRRTGRASGLMHVRTASGESRLWEYNNSLRTDGLQKPLVRGMARDITERKLAEAKLMESEARYRALFEQSHDAVFILDTQGKHITANQRAASLLGYTIEEIQKLSVHDTSVELEQSLHILERLLAGEHSPLYERQFRKRNGELVPVEINVELVRNAEGNPLHIQSVVRDITGRKDAEEKIQRQITYLNALRDIDRAINSSFDMQASFTLESNGKHS
jgi:PAS domain S-box-containing protein